MGFFKKDFDESEQIDELQEELQEAAEEELHEDESGEYSNSLLKNDFDVVYSWMCEEYSMMIISELSTSNASTASTTNYISTETILDTTVLSHDSLTENNISEDVAVLDYAAASYGNQYGASTYGWYIDTSLNSGNAGYSPAYSINAASCIAEGGQSVLNNYVVREVVATRNMLLDRGIELVYFNCHVYDNGAGTIYVVVYYG